MMPDTILVLDFGGQYSHLIARRVRELKVFSQILPCDIHPEEVKALGKSYNLKGIILSGGPSSVYIKNSPRFNPELLRLGIPVMGLCYGHQLIAFVSKGKVTAGEKQEYGITYVTIDKPVGVLKKLSRREKVWMSHGDTVHHLPEDFESLAHTENCPIAAFRHRKKPIYGLQWHPEVVHTEHGMEIFKNFVFNICKCRANWRAESIIKKGIEEIKQIVAHKKAIIALSGGIDSGTATVLASNALRENLTAVFVDHGFMREGEPEFVKETFQNLGVKVITIKAKERFLKKLMGIVNPEEKRKIIGEEFIRVFEEVARNTGAEYLIQGTIYPDRIESGIRKHSDKIKSHHNVAGLPTRIRFKAVVEPLKDLYKDEVRGIAKNLDLPNDVIGRQPFPGPGLAVRIIGEVTREKIDLVRKADTIVSEEMEKSGLKELLWQYFAVLTETKSTGVKGDMRTYGYTVAVRAVESKEAMTASFAKVPYDVLEKISTRITNELPAVTRVVYDITHKPPATIEWE